MIKFCPSLNFVHFLKKRSRARWGGSGGVYLSSATWGGTANRKPRHLPKMALKILRSFPETPELSPSFRLRPPCFDHRFTQKDDFIDISFNTTGSEPVSCWRTCCRSVSSHHTVPAEVIPRPASAEMNILSWNMIYLHVWSSHVQISDVIHGDIWRHIDITNKCVHTPIL